MITKAKLGLQEAQTKALAKRKAIAIIILAGVCTMLVHVGSARPQPSRVVSGLSLAGAQTRRNDVVTLSTVSTTATLAASGTTLTTPSTSDPPVTAAQADAVAVKSQGGGNVVLEHALANLTDTGVPGMTNRLVWVVSVMPPGGMPWSEGGPDNGPPQQATYMLVFVDANTGHYLYGASGGSVASSSSPGAARESHSALAKAAATYLIIRNPYPQILLTVNPGHRSLRVPCAGLRSIALRPASRRHWSLYVSRPKPDHILWRRRLTVHGEWYFLYAGRRHVQLSGPSAYPSHAGPSMHCFK